MKEKVFSNGLVVKHRKHAVILENNQGVKKGKRFYEFTFSKNEFKKFLLYIEKVSNEAWVNIQPKEVTGVGSDYSEYYDVKYDNNGYLNIKDNGLLVDPPFLSVDTLYQFNKPRMESFIFDLREKLFKEENKALDESLETIRKTLKSVADLTDEQVEEFIRISNDDNPEQLKQIIDKIKKQYS